MNIVSINDITTKSIPKSIDIIAVENSMGKYLMYAPQDLVNRNLWQQVNKNYCEKSEVISQGVNTEYILNKGE